MLIPAWSRSRRRNRRASYEIEKRGGNAAFFVGWLRIAGRERSA
jgi:hypothetical protein